MNQTLIVFKIGSQRYCVDILKIKEICMYQDTVVIPNKPSFVEGIISLRGDVLCIINLSKRININSTANINEQKIIVTNVDDINVGFLVDDVEGILHIDNSEFQSAPKIAQNNNDFIDGVIEKDSLIISLDLKKVLSDTELQAVTEISRD